MPDRLPEEVRRLLARIDSVAQLEVLLLLQRTVPDEWSARQLGEELRLEPAWAAEQLEFLRGRGMLAESEPGSGVYRFQPDGPELAKAVEALAAHYADRRVAVIAQVHSQPTDRIRVFADAFRIRPEDEGDG